MKWLIGLVCPCLLFAAPQQEEQQPQVDSTKEISQSEEQPQQTSSRRQSKRSVKRAERYRRPVSTGRPRVTQCPKPDHEDLSVSKHREKKEPKQESDQPCDKKIVKRPLSSASQKERRAQNPANQQASLETDSSSCFGINRAEKEKESQTTIGALSRKPSRIESEVAGGGNKPPVASKRNPREQKKKSMKAKRPSARSHYKNNAQDQSQNPGQVVERKQLRGIKKA